MTEQHFILGMAGHIDHGKSALVLALTGVDPDRLPEEQSRGMTIDLGFAHLELPSCQRPETLYQLGIVDVPGHAGFINNMVSGIGAIDVALLTVAADDLWMPQSEEHLQILAHLGSERAVVALTKADLVDDPQPLIAQLREQLENSPFCDAPIVPTSVVTGEGIDRLRTALAEVLDETPAPADLGKPRLGVDRVFIQHGIGTIVTGTLIGGTLQQGQQVIVQPSGLAARIRSIQSHNQELQSVGPGRRTAVNLADVPIAEKGRPGIARGDMIALAEQGEPTDTLDVRLVRTSRQLNEQQPLQHATRVRWHHGGAHVGAQVYLIDCDQLEPGQEALAQIRLERPLLVFAGDKFLVRSWSKTATLAGGEVLQPAAVRRHYRDPRRIAALQCRWEARGDLKQSILAALSDTLAIEAARLMLQSHYSTSQIETAVAELVEQQELVFAADYVLNASVWQNLIDQAAERIEAEHLDQPQLLGLDLAQLRQQFQSQLPDPRLVDALVDALCERGVQRTGGTLHRATHLPELPAHLASAGQQIRTVLGDSQFKPPPRKEIATTQAAGEALRFLIRQGEVVEISPELVLAGSCYQKARQQVRQYLEANGPASVSKLRELLGTNRRVIIPLLEHFDREGLTRRRDNTRELK